MTTIQVAPGDILLTSGIGGPDAKWKDRLLTQSIIRAQALQSPNFEPTTSHAELITTHLGETFAARWRTRRRINGLCDYMGSRIIIGSPAKSVGMTSPKFWMAWEKARMHCFDGAVYPLHRLIIQGLSAILLPRWITSIGVGNKAICSEIVAAFYHGYGIAEFRTGWRGWTPSDIERLVMQGDALDVSFEGMLSAQIMRDSGLPIYDSEGRLVE